MVNIYVWRNSDETTRKNKYNWAIYNEDIPVALNIERHAIDQKFKNTLHGLLTDEFKKTAKLFNYCPDQYLIENNSTENSSFSLQTGLKDIDVKEISNILGMEVSTEKPCVENKLQINA